MELLDCALIWVYAVIRLNTVAQKVINVNFYRLRDVTLDVAEDRQTRQDRAYAVEQCVCPVGYRGLSCEVRCYCYWIFNATRLPRHIEAAAIVMHMYLSSLAFMDLPCTLGAAVCHQGLPCPFYAQPRACRV